jgi:hypothetical protein
MRTGANAGQGRRFFDQLGGAVGVTYARLLRAGVIKNPMRLTNKMQGCHV